MERSRNILFEYRWTIFAVFLLGLLPRVINIICESTIELDGIIYAKMGDAFARGAFWEALREVFPPFYPALIGFFRLFIPDVEIAGRLVSLLAGLTVIFLYLHFFKGVTDERKALFGSFLIAIHPFLIRSSSVVLSESVAIVLFACTIFLFYRGLTENDTFCIVLSGFFLSLTYLTRPEYIVYCVPLVLLLLVRKRFSQAVFFLFCFSVLTFAYIYYLKCETGLLVISKKAILAKNKPVLGPQYHSYLFPFLPIKTILKHIPSVCYNFFVAITVPFLILAIIGFTKVEKTYRLLVVSLVAFHITSIATMSSSSRRFSFEFIPLIIPFSVEGAYVLKGFFERYQYKKILCVASLLALILISLFQGLVLSGERRILHKMAGQHLFSEKPGSVVLARLPIVSFYGKGQWVNIKSVASKDSDCTQLFARLKERKVEYLALDEKTEKEYPAIAQCLGLFPLVREFRDNDGFLKLHRVNLD